MIPVFAAFSILGLVAGAFAQTTDGDLRVFVVELRDGKATPPHIQVKKDERVLLRWMSDEETSVHLHGYDIEIVIHPGHSAEMGFTAHATGRFAIEAHRSSGPGEAHRRTRALLHVDVLPR